MEFRELGTTGERISSIGLGTWQLAGMMGAVDRRKAAALIREAVDRGINFIDTAEKYGIVNNSSERLFVQGTERGVFSRRFFR